MNPLLDHMITIMAFILIGLAVIPLLLVALGALASYFDLGIAGPILAVAVRLVTLQWISGGVVNVLAGLALAALGIWAVLHFDPLLHRILSAALVPFGLWRIFRGVAVLRQWTKTDAP
ncbi:hypothetical protein [Sphingomonas alpina]|uniref:DUF4175 domain-containing protein n=1 Tax=Sphingomonas alpina TaxID=653931 RepID=A0A7H0LEK9_9SPHN|nr:hypothetical protein [Sphingomonas alpina]QNQ08112.1 hypothetical protein H3Z74_15195 [Sphingomonas alpina]